MLTTMSTVESNEPDEEEEEEDGLENKSFFNSLLTLDLESLIIGKNKINNKNGWTLLIISMLVIGLACLILVAACEMIGSESYSLPFIGELNGLNIPIMFIAVVLASAATSVPDTIISVRDARNGNYNDAISNALGSNIFDVCFALGLPLFLYCLFYGPITMSPETVQFSSELRILLLIMTIIAFFVYIIGSRMTKLKGFILLTIYILFTIYIVGRSIDASWAQVVSDYLGMIYNFIT
jgi:cation:H+ antiporter